MSVTEGSGSNFEQWFQEIHATGEAAESRVRIELDGTGQLLDVVIEPKAMRLASDDLADAIKEAFGAARSAVQEQIQEKLAESPPTPTVEPADMRSALDELQFDANRKLDAFGQMAQELSAKIDRML